VGRWRGEEGPRECLGRPGTEGRAAAEYFGVDIKSCMDLLPSTKDKRKRCMLQCQSDQREDRLLWRSMRWFVEFSKKV
jgi:hypothetical protein